MIGNKVMMRLRLSEGDVHYAGGLIEGAFVIRIFGDIATELLIRHDGDEGLFAAYDMIEFKAQLKAGDFLEAWGWIDKVGNTSRHMQFEAYKVITNAEKNECPSACKVISEPLLVARASGTCVVPGKFQRGAQCPEFKESGGQ